MKKKTSSQITESTTSKQMNTFHIVEDEVCSLVKAPLQKENIVDIIDQIEMPSNIDSRRNLKSAFYEDKSDKYGF